MSQILDGSFNPEKYETSLQRLEAKTIPSCQFSDCVLKACMVDETNSQESMNYKSFQEFTKRELIPALKLPKYNHHLPPKQLSLRDSIECHVINDLINTLIAQDLLLGYEITILEGDAR